MRIQREEVVAGGGWLGCGWRGRSVSRGGVGGIAEGAKEREWGMGGGSDVVTSHHTSGKRQALGTAGQARFLLAQAERTSVVICIGSSRWFR